MKKKAIIVCLLHTTGCAYKFPLFDYGSTSTNMYHWSVCDTAKGGVTFTMYHSYNDSLQRHYFVTYSTISDFGKGTYNYHVTSVNYHKDSVNLKKLHRIENYNSGEKLLVKQNRKGYFSISSEWDNTYAVKIKTLHNGRAQPLYSAGEAVYPLSGIDFISGNVKTNAPVFTKRPLLLSTYTGHQLGMADDSLFSKNYRYFEYICMFDSVAYVLNGFRLSTGEMSFTRLKVLSSDLIVRRRDIPCTVEMLGVSESKQPGVFYPTQLKITLNNGSVILTDIPPVDQEIRSMKWGAWVGFGNCHISSAVDRKSKKGCLKLIIL